MLDPETIAALADELAEADRTHSVIPRITARYPEATIEDSYAIQGVWRDQNLAAGRRLVGSQDRAHLEGDAAGDGHHRTRLRRHVRGHRLPERRRDPGRPLLQRPHRGRARVRAEGAARRPRLHPGGRAPRDRLRRARPRGAQLAHRTRGPHDRRHDLRQRRLRRDGARRRRTSGPTRSICAGCPACSRATARSKRPASRPACSATRRPASPGSRTSCISTAPGSKPARSSSPDRSRAPCGSPAATPSTVTMDRWEQSHADSSEPDLPRRARGQPPARSPASGSAPGRRSSPRSAPAPAWTGC